MAKQIVFAVFDKQAKLYQNFFFAKSIAEAIRSFTTAVNDPNTQLNQFPDDFELFKVCEINEDTAIVANVEITALGLARTYQKRLPQLTGLEQLTS
jgi:hypothetical protein